MAGIIGCRSRCGHPCHRPPSLSRPCCAGLPPRCAATRAMSWAWRGRQTHRCSRDGTLTLTLTRTWRTWNLILTLTRTLTLAFTVTLALTVTLTLAPTLTLTLALTLTLTLTFHPHSASRRSRLTTRCACGTCWRTQRASSSPCCRATAPWSRA